MPQRLDVDEISDVFPELLEIADPALRRGVAEIWCEIAAEMPWDDIRTIPKSVRSRCSMVKHIRGVTQMAIALSEIAQRLHGKAYDRDLLVAACLLHDASRPVEAEPDPAVPSGVRASRLGKNIQHGVYAAHKILEKGLSFELANLVITHTHKSGVRGTTWEAAALFYADYADTDADFSSTGIKLYLQRWALAE